MTDNRAEKDRKGHEKEIAVWSENYAALERRVEKATSEADELRTENERLRDGLKDIAALRVITASDMAVNILKGADQ